MGTVRRWSQVAEAVRATTRTSEKVAIVADYLRTLEPPELAIAVVFLSGRPFPEHDERVLGLGWAAISRSAEAVAGARSVAVDAAAPERARRDPAADDGRPDGPVPGASGASGGLGAAYDRSSDLGTAVGDLLAEVGFVPSGPAPTLVEVADAFEAIAAARRPAAKQAAFGALLARCDPLVARYVTRILTGELRIGFREGHLEAAIARAFGRAAEDVRWTGMLSGDIGRTALLAREDRLAESALALFHPLKPMLASPVADEAEAVARMTPPVWVEDKYDGIRAQLHRDATRVRIFSRDLRDVTGQFPEIVRSASDLPWAGILDGEILAWRDDAALPFLLLQARLGRKDPTAAIQADVPVIFVAFDLLAHGPAGDGPVEPLLRLPLRERRARLESLGLSAIPGFGLATLRTAADEAALTAMFEEAQARGNEGLVVKDPDRAYSPGRRGYAWLKLKKALTTLDCVVVGVEIGHGKRHGVLSDYTFAVMDDRPGAEEGRLVTIGKAYTGLTDAAIARMTRWFEAHTLTRHGRYRVVEPSVVVEIAFDVIHRSTRHASGFALRFPRIVRIRDDKEPHQIDRLSTVAALHERLQAGGRYGVLTAGTSATAVNGR
jgi:DNA ligase-1